MCEAEQRGLENEGLNQREGGVKETMGMKNEWARRTGGVEGRNGGYPTKKDRRERSESSGERCEGMFSQLPTLLWILRFKGLFFFFTLGEKGEESEGQGTWGGLLARCSPGSDVHPARRCTAP